MKIIIETPDFRPSLSLKEFVMNKVAKLGRLHKAILSAEVTIEMDSKKTKDIVKCSILLDLPGKNEYVKASSALFEDAVLKAVEAAQRRLRIRKTQIMENRKAVASVKTK